MVLFQNINVKARVEALWRGDIHEGTVRYTGVLVGRSGEWIGVELDRAVIGGHSGLHRGVQYFSCQFGHGIFVHARNIRFISSKRTLFNSYRTVSVSSSIDTTLFGSQGLYVYILYFLIAHNALWGDKAAAIFDTVEFLDASSDREQEPPRVTSKYVEQLLNKDHVMSNMWTNQKRFYKSHLIGNHIRPSTAPPQHHTTTSPQPYKTHFISPSSIPSTHVPRPLLKRMLKQDYFGTTIPRYTSL
ncbi:hypothetical protein QZH41_020311 [Actinostola sp. cb2023]|nr:hypothetical protein QZH41_020311 [Actinostola sp. cb2023]